LCKGSVRLFASIVVTKIEVYNLTPPSKNLKKNVNDERVICLNSRVFIFSLRKCNGETGGPGGVNYRLLKANSSYQLLDKVERYYSEFCMDYCGRWD
jgi:hypothetical protein